MASRRRAQTTRTTATRMAFLNAPFIFDGISILAVWPKKRRHHTPRADRFPSYAIVAFADKFCRLQSQSEEFLMAFGMYAASVPVYQRQLAAISKVLEKGSAWAAAKKVDEAVIMGTRMIPDMLPFSRQVQIACASPRKAWPAWPASRCRRRRRTPRSCSPSCARIDAVLAFIKSFKPEQIDGSEGREITLTIGGNPLSSRARNISRLSRCRTSISIAPRPTQSCVSPASKSGNGISSAASEVSVHKPAPPIRLACPRHSV